MDVQRRRSGHPKHRWKLGEDTAALSNESGSLLNLLIQQPGQAEANPPTIHRPTNCDSDFNAGSGGGEGSSVLSHSTPQLANKAAISALALDTKVNPTHHPSQGMGHSFCAIESSRGQTPCFINTDDQPLVLSHPYNQHSSVTPSDLQSNPGGCSAAASSKESPNYLDTTLDSGYITKDGNFSANLDETVESDDVAVGQRYHNNDKHVNNGSCDGDTVSPDNFTSTSLAEGRENRGTRLATNPAVDRVQIPALLQTSHAPVSCGGLVSLTTRPCGGEGADRGGGSQGPIVGGSTIFDCEMGCFISIEEYKLKYGVSEENLS